jgi:hypothetical protein
MSRRRSTIHDAAALRLHPNGVRVNDVVQTTKATVTTRTPYHACKVPIGNWIATDAGGDGRITKRRKFSQGQSQDVEGAPSSEGQGEGDTAETRLGGQGEDIPIKVYKDARANRRAAFETDLTFLSPPTPVSEGTPSRLQPSSVRNALPLTQLFVNNTVGFSQKYTSLCESVLWLPRAAV